MSGPVAGTVQGNALSLHMRSTPKTIPIMTVGLDQISAVIPMGSVTLKRSN